MDIQQRVEQLIGQRAQAVQRREALGAQLKDVEEQVLRLDGAILAYQEMAEAREKADAEPKEA